MNTQVKKRHRCTTFPAEERLLIANICSKYKDILENKKTDNLLSEEKNITWEKIASEINASAINATFRSVDVLKRFYENRKREVRKIAAEEKKEILATGGGRPVGIKKDACLVGIMNKKTVCCLQNDFDGDAEPIPNIVPNFPVESGQPESSSELPIKISMDNDIEIIYELKDTDLGTPSWKKYVPANLRQPITPKLVNFSDFVASTETSKRRCDEETHVNTTQKKSILLPISRRRPAVNVKSLTRPELAEKHDKLLDKLEIASYQKKKLEQEVLFTEEEQKIKIELLKIQIEKEKGQLALIKK